MKEDYVNIDTAKVLKELGFDWEIKGFFRSISLGTDEETGCVKQFSPMDVNHNRMKGLSCTYYSRPTLSLAQKWIREAHNIAVDSTFCITCKLYITHRISTNLDGINYEEENRFYTYEEALGFGLLEALKIIKGRQT